MRARIAWLFAASSAIANWRSRSCADWSATMPFSISSSAVRTEDLYARNAPSAAAWFERTWL
jgi:hypothetical protein